MKSNETTTGIALALALIFLSHSTLAMQKEDRDDDAAFKEALARSRYDVGGYHPSNQEADIPLWVLEESRRSAAINSNNDHFSQSFPDSDIPDWVLEDSHKLTNQTGRKSAEEIQLINDRELAKAIQLSLGEALPIISYDPEMERQEDQLAILLKECTQAVKEEEMETAIILVTSFMSIDNLYPLILKQAEDILSTLQNQKSTSLPIINVVNLDPVDPVISQSNQPTNSSGEPTKEEYGMVELTNFERKKDGKIELKVNPLLTTVARKHSENMARLNQFDHVVEGKSVSDRVKEAAYQYSYVGENISYVWGIGYAMNDHHYSIQKSMNGLMNSPGHKANILSPHFTEIGIGIAITPDGRKYFTQVFGSPR